MTDQPLTAQDAIGRADSVAAAATSAFAAAKSLPELEEQRVKFLGRKSDIIALSRSLKDVPPADRKTVGKAMNDAKKQIETAHEEHKARLSAAGDDQLAPNAIDVTLPGIRNRYGRRHPLMSTMEELKRVLIGLGFRYDDYPEVETEFYNFDGLNTPEWHPARDMHDTFYTTQGRVLRTHTTAFQVHAMRELAKPPLRMMTSGRCYRCDAIDASHFPIFHQLDVIAIDRGTSFADLKWTLYEMARALFGSDVKLQFRPSFFPFTTPSAEVDVFFNGRWLEILGSGMMRPEVLAAGGLDPSEWQGFAFGVGIDRMAMIRYGIDDIRYLYENEESFLRQF